jgi:hypothetical protein
VRGWRGDRTPSEVTDMRGAGGRPGGAGLFLFGFVLAAGGLWLLFDSVRATTAPFGLVSGWMHGFGGGFETTSQAIVFVPFILGVGLLFYESRWRVGWVLFGLGLLLLLVEIMSRIRFFLNVKLTALLLMLTLIAAGTALMLRALRDSSPGEGEERASD